MSNPKYKVTRPEGMPDWFEPGIWCEVSFDGKVWSESNVPHRIDLCFPSKLSVTSITYQDQDGCQYPYARPWIEPAEQVFDSRGLPLVVGDPAGTSDDSSLDALNDMINFAVDSNIVAFHADDISPYEVESNSLKFKWRYVVRARTEDIEAERERRKTKMRLMTRDEAKGFAYNTPGIEICINDGYWYHPAFFDFDNPIEYCQYRTLSLDGIYGPPMRFEKPVEDK